MTRVTQELLAPSPRAPALRTDHWPGKRLLLAPMNSRVEAQFAQVRSEAAHTSSNSLKTNPASAIWPRAQGQSLKVEPRKPSLPSGRIKEECAVKHTAWLYASVSTSVEWTMSPPSHKERGQWQCLPGSGLWHVTSGLPLPLQVQCPL